MLAPLTYGLTDRLTGTVYFLKAKDGYITLHDQPNSVDRGRAIIYPAKSGPMLGQTNVRLLVRDGQLGYEVVESHIPDGVSLPPLRPYDLLHRRTNYVLKLPAGFTGTEPLAYEITNV